MWGQVTRYLHMLKDSRIIPTRVGTSTDYNTPYISIEDHPHACGDKYLLFVVLLSYQGSSPRVWGQVYVAVDESTARRIIPTRVGTSAREIRKDETNQDHPHACGDKVCMISQPPI